MITANRYHDISVGHRVHGHESKCRHLHGHNYRVHFKVMADVTEPELDHLGRVMDFSVIKEKLCMWLEVNWDHKFLAWDQDTLMKEISTMVFDAAVMDTEVDASNMLQDSLVLTPFNPTAENMAEYLVNVIGPKQLAGTGCILVECSIEETRKCSVTYTKG